MHADVIMQFFQRPITSSFSLQILSSDITDFSSTGMVGDRSLAQNEQFI